MGEYVAIGTVQMETRGPVPEGAVELARDRVTALLRLSKEPVLSARIKLTVRAEQGRTRLAMAQANLDVDGRPVRAQAIAETMWRAVNELRDRLLIRLARVSRDWPVRRGGRPLTSPREWRPSGVPGRRPPELAPPDGDRYVVRHKVIKPFLETPLEAALDMELLDYDFYLFVDAVTGEDCVIDRSGSRYRVVRQLPAPEEIRGNGGPVLVDDEPAPVLTPAQALGRLTEENLAYVFFSDPETHGSRIVYRRYDGHYGVITACPR
ncbi:MAG TPA: sigma 54 modulation/S30EA ribosomal C-terminal domain-containing protein [Streptosporangiaceae bacterium]|nr:sigma 54 modulation/S30EA ribosomal C-terminal domain-containing protein [Streptosporangiaceae bacterium]